MYIVRQHKHTHSLSLTLSLSHTHAHTHTQVQYGEFAEVAFILIYQSMHEAAVAAEMAAFLDDIA